MVRCNKIQMPARHSLSLTLNTNGSLTENIYGSVQQKSNASLSLTFNIRHILSRAWTSMARLIRNQMPGRHSTVCHWHWTYISRCSKNQMAGRHSLSLIMNIHASVQQKSNARKAQSIIDVECTWLGAGGYSLSIVDFLYTWLVCSWHPSQEGCHSLSLKLNINGSRHGAVDVDYTWDGAAEIKCQEDTVSH